MTLKVELRIRENVCANGWARTDGTACDYTGGHYCDLDAGHRGKCRCPCGFVSTRRRTPE